ncbi:MAG: hypothetical protein KIT60_01115 [Burkholderiaceae bacterium]|nr:hypothetical protein [Burkholderiaceae bacterium]
MRFLILALVVGLVVWWLVGRSRKRTTDHSDTRSSQTPTAFAVCAHCGVHLPISDAVLDGQTAYCSDAHRLAGPRQRG